jgi:hypothetical protein
MFLPLIDRITVILHIFGLNQIKLKIYYEREAVSPSGC